MIYCQGPPGGRITQNAPRLVPGRDWVSDEPRAWECVRTEERRAVPHFAQSLTPCKGVVRCA